MKSKAVEIICFLCVSIFALFFAALNLICPYRYKEYIKKHSLNYGLNPAFVAAIIYSESGFKNDAKSKKNAIGLMQIMPATAKLFLLKNNEEFNENVLFDAEKNIEIGCWYLNYLLKKYRDETTVLACYNAGEGNVLRWMSGNDKLEKTQIGFNETLNYVNKVQKMQKFYKYIIK